MLYWRRDRAMVVLACVSLREPRAGRSLSIAVWKQVPYSRKRKLPRPLLHLKWKLSNSISRRYRISSHYCHRVPLGCLWKCVTHSSGDYLKMIFRDTCHHPVWALSGDLSTLAHRVSPFPGRARTRPQGCLECFRSDLWGVRVQAARGGMGVVLLGAAPVCFFKLEVKPPRQKNAGGALEKQWRGKIFVTCINQKLFNSLFCAIDFGVSTWISVYKCGF